MDSISEAREFHVNFNKKENGEIDMTIEKTVDNEKKTLVNAHFINEDSLYIFELFLKTFTGKIKE